MANVNFKRGDTATMNATAISDGLIFLNTENNKIYFDNGSTRLQFGGDTSLISSVDDADVDNAFNASASVNLFAQKNSIVDTKANALAVTQPQIPLGCLAFKETVGTTNISTIGNGTLSGAISALNTGKANTNLNNITGTVPVNKGGTGQTSLQATRNAMGLGNTTGALPVANGGTGSSNTDIARGNLGCGNIAIYNIYTQVEQLVTSMASWQTSTYGLASHGNKACFAATVSPAGRWEGTADFQCYVTIENGGADVVVHYRSSVDYMAMGFTLVMLCVH
jgi:hypothetical protein